MKLKMDEQRLLDYLNEDVLREVKAAFKAPRASYYGHEVEVSMNDVISGAITKGIVKGIKILLEQQYTDEDFEKDLTLR